MMKDEKRIRQEYRGELRILKGNTLTDDTRKWHRGYISALRWVLRKRV